MSLQERSYMGDYPIAAEVGVAERAAFVRKTYQHLAGAIGLFAVLETILLQLPGIEDLVFRMCGTGWSWLIVLGLFMLVSHIANRWARSTTSIGMQYAGLGLFVVAEAVIFLPLLYIAKFYGGNVGGIHVIPAAGIMTGTIFLGLTAIVFTTRKDFSFLRSALCIAGFAALGLIACSAIFGFSLGVVFTVAMIAFAAGYILYDTSNILHHYRTDQHVAAALALFASVALLFWYILQLLMALSNRD